MNESKATSGATDAEPDKDAEIHRAVEGVLRQLEEHAGQEGFRHLYDKALHVLVAIDQAGFRIVRKPVKR